MAKALDKFAHPDYRASLPDYVKIRDCSNGERAVKAAGTVYLPALTGQSLTDYDNYRRRALFFPITGKTASTLVGLITTRRPDVSYPDPMSMYFVDTNHQYQFTEFYVTALTEVVMMGRYGVLVDASIDQTSDPMPIPYIAENILRWEVDRYGMLVSLLLRETDFVPGKDEFELVSETCYRHCFLNDQGVYTVRVLDEDLVEVPNTRVNPTFSGSQISYIPFVCFGSSGVHFHVDRPPLLDIATINISHYMTSADLEWGRHIVGLPTPVVSGVDSGTTLMVGGTRAWVLPPAEAKAYYLEFVGQGLSSLERALSEKIGLMASMSARMIDNSTRGSEAAETVRLRYMSEAAGLVQIVNSVETGFTVLYNLIRQLRRDPGTVSMKLSREILGMNIGFKDLKTLFEMYIGGALSKESLLYNLRRLDAVDPQRSDAEELSAFRDPESPEPSDSSGSGDPEQPTKR